MPNSRKSLKVQRYIAYKNQNGLCYYCKHPMWKKDPSDFSKKFHTSIKLASLFQCTGEHLVPHSEGGTMKQNNIVASCKFCNQQRHRRKNILSPKEYTHFVQARIKQGRWSAGILRNIKS